MKYACPILVRSVHVGSHAVVDLHFDPLGDSRNWMSEAWKANSAKVQAKRSQ